METNFSDREILDVLYACFQIRGELFIRYVSEDDKAENSSFLALWLSNISCGGSLKNRSYISMNFNDLHKYSYTYFIEQKNTNLTTGKNKGGMKN